MSELKSAVVYIAVLIVAVICFMMRILMLYLVALNQLCTSITLNHLFHSLQDLELQLESERSSAIEAREFASNTERKLIAIQIELEDVRGLLESVSELLWALQSADHLIAIIIITLITQHRLWSTVR